MNKLVGLSFVLNLIFSQQAFGFNNDECSKDIGKRHTGLGGGLISTTQFVSSWGGCSMFGQIESDKKVFLTDNLDKIRDDSAKGNGEYLLAYSKLAGCNSEKGGLFMTSVQKKYEDLFAKSSEPQELYTGLESILNEVCL